MSKNKQVAIILDGGFLLRKLKKTQCETTKKWLPISAEQVERHVHDIMMNDHLNGYDLFRAYYYDSVPHEKTEKRPFGGVFNFSKTEQHSTNRSRQDKIELLEDFAVRRGSLSFDGWKLNNATLRELKRSEFKRELKNEDFVPDLKQKGVDIKIALDIAQLAIKKIVDAVVLVSGDLDMVPAMKLARKEGLKVYLDVLGHPVRRELKAHADKIL